MFARDRKTPIAEWWWTIDKQLLSALILLMAVGMVLSFAASPPVAERLGLSPWHFIIRHAMFDLLALAGPDRHVVHDASAGAPLGACWCWWSQSCCSG